MMNEKQKIKELQDELRKWRRLVNSTNRGMMKIKKEELQDMKLQFKNIQKAVKELQKENKKLKVDGRIVQICESEYNYDYELYFNSSAETWTLKILDVITGNVLFEEQEYQENIYKAKVKILNKLTIDRSNNE